MTAPEQPRYKHFCLDGICVFLAQSGKYDLYWHAGTTPGWENVIARWGHSANVFDRSMIKIGLNEVGFDAELTEAFDRACAEGLVPPKVQKKHGPVADTMRAANQDA